MTTSSEVLKLPAKRLFRDGRVPEALTDEERRWLVEQLHRWPSRVNEARTCYIGALTNIAATEFCRLMAEATRTASRPSPIEAMAELRLPREALEILDEMSEEIGYSAATIASHINRPAQQIREWQRAFRLLGIAEFGVLYDLDGEGLRGRGYWLNGRGCEAQKRARAALKSMEQGDG